MQTRMMVAVALLTAGIFGGASTALAARAAGQAELLSVSGEVEWQQAGGDWEAASLDQQLGAGDKIRTGEDGKATLSLQEGSTIELEGASELSIIVLSHDPDIEQHESIFGLWEGRLIAKVNPVPEGSVFEIETRTTTIDIVPAAGDPTVIVTINPDGSVSVRSEEGAVELRREGDNRLRLRLETGEEALVEYDPGTGVLRVTSLNGTFEVVGPDNFPITLASGDTVVYSAGAATFIPGSTPVGDVPAAGAIGEPIT